MATSEIYIWKETKLKPDLNFYVEHINDYLRISEAVHIENFQFLELKPKMSIRLDLNQYNLQFDINYAYDYCLIRRNGEGFDDPGAYYFITNMKWKSKSCIEFELEMDVLNSFDWDSDYEVDKKTLIKREHKNRFYTTNSWTYTSEIIKIPSGTTVLHVETPLMANARIKSVGAISILQGTNVTGQIHFTNPSNLLSGYCVVFLTTDAAQEVQYSFTYQVYAYIGDIDLKSEGINAPLYKQKEFNLEDLSGTQWSLLYKNTSEPDPATLTNGVECLLYPSRDLTIEIPSTGPKLDTNNVIDTDWMVITDKYNDPIPSFLVNNESISPSYYSSGTPGTFNASAVAFKKIGGQVAVQYCTYGVRTVTQAQAPYYHLEDYCTWVDKGSYTSIAVNTTLQSLKYNKQASLPATKAAMLAIRPEAQGTSTVVLGAGVLNETIYSKDSIDRTDPKNIKLITLPYCPTPITVSASNVVLGTEWWYNDHHLELRDLNTRFRNRITTYYSHPIAPLVFKTHSRVLDGTGLRTSGDPKLYHSDFSYNKFVYDSFGKIFRNECLDWRESLKASGKESNFEFDFITSRNIVSKFLFMFPQYTCGDKGTEDYDNILPVARNNEEVLYNSQYLNYLRTGYNYDLKTKERNETVGAVGLGVSVASLIGSLALTASGYGSAIGVAGVVGSVAGIAGSAINYAKTTAQAEESIQRKLQEAQNQSVSVSSADDYDLLEAYSGNLAKMCSYEVSPQMWEALDDVFYYAGYTVNEQRKPDVSTRYWFNFLQCDLVCNGWNNISKEIQDLIKQKFSEGVTFFHRHILNGIYHWDIDQEMDNWETWIVLANGGSN